MCGTSLTEYIANNMPEVNIVQLIDNVSHFSYKFLFFYCPVMIGVLIALKGLEFLFRGIKLCNMSRNGKYVRGRVVAKYRENGEFFETGRLFMFSYPIVEYKYQGEVLRCIANKPGKPSIGVVKSVYVCEDGNEHLITPGLVTVIISILLIVFGLILSAYIYNSFNIFV